MEAVQLFLKINKPSLNNEWNAKITASLKELPSIEQLQVIEQNESSDAKINISYDIDKVSLDEIELLLKNDGATITEINIHFPSSISGVSSPYGASAIALTIEERLKMIKGIFQAGISQDGEIKILLAPTIENKQRIIEQTLKIISSIKSGNSNDKEIL